MMKVTLMIRIRDSAPSKLPKKNLSISTGITAILVEWWMEKAFALLARKVVTMCL